MFFARPESKGFLLAGGAALLAQHLSARPTEELDFFTAPERGHVPDARDALEAAARERGWSTERIHDGDTLPAGHPRRSRDGPDRPGRERDTGLPSVRYRDGADARAPGTRRAHGCGLGVGQASVTTVTPTTAKTASSGWNPSQASSADSKQTSPAPAIIDRPRACARPRHCRHPASRKPQPTNRASSERGARPGTTPPGDRAQRARRRDRHGRDLLHRLPHRSLRHLTRLRCGSAGRAQGLVPPRPRDLRQRQASCLPSG